MRTIVFALALAAAPAVALACDTDSGSNSATFMLRDGSTTHLIGPVKDLKRMKSKLRGHDPALFVRLDGREYVIYDAATVDRARAIFQRTVPSEAKQEALDRDMDALERKQYALDEDDAEHAKLDAEERALDRRQEELDAVHDAASGPVELDLERLAREAIRTGKAI